MYPLALYSSNTAYYSSNLAVTSSNELYPQAYYSSNTAYYSSNTAYYSSNTAYYSSNTAYYSSNTAYYSSNTAISASNKAYAGGQWTNNSSNIYILSSNVGIGTLAPIVNLHIASTNLYSQIIDSSNSSTGTALILYQNYSGSTNSNLTLAISGGNNQWSQDSIKGDAIIQTTNNRLLFNTNGGTGNSSICMLNNGYVGIGTTSPIQALELYRSGMSSYIRISGDYTQQKGIELYDTNSKWLIYKPISFADLRFYDGVGDRVTFKYGGNVGLGMNVPVYQLDLSTDGARKLSTSTWLTGSDQRVKLNIMNADLDICYSNIKAINLKRFQWDSNYYPLLSDRNTLGWIAQEVQEVYPKAVSESESFGFSNFLSLNSDIIIKTMYGALQKTMNNIETLTSEFETYKSIHP